MENGMPRLKITLGRNGKGLVEGLIMNKALGTPSGKNVKVRCVKRIAGAYSKVVSTAPIPLMSSRAFGRTEGVHPVVNS
jgi:hypothetical protein